MKLMLDENISPALVRPLWQLEVDTTTTRDRGLLNASDHKVWQYAQAEERTVVTINAGDFEKLARHSPDHCGLVIIPSGHTRDGQLQMIVSVIEAARAEHAVMPSLRRRTFRVSEGGAISMEPPEPSPTPVVSPRIET